MNNRKIQELLEQFFAGYFNQDWQSDAEDPRGIVALYIADASEEERRILSESILEYASQFKDDAELEEKLFSELGAFYMPSADGLTAHAWLQSVAAQLLDG